MKDVCENCKAFFRKNEKEGECRRHAPTAADVRVPIVNANFWCLEFWPEEKPSEEV